MDTKILFIVILLLSGGIQLLAQADENQLKINEKEYFHSDNVSVLVYHNIYPVGMQGGIEIIQHNLRTATNGNVVFRLNEEIELIPGVNVSQSPIPQINNPERVINGEQIKLPFQYEDIQLEYEMVLTPTEDFGFEVQVNFLSPVDTNIIDEIYYQMEFYPELYAGKSFISENDFGVFPFVFKGTGARYYPSIIASGKEFTFAPEDERIGITISSATSDLLIEDSRLYTRRYWFSLRTYADLSKTTGAISIKFQPNIIENWIKPPMIAYSQIGYHPGQEKKVIIELDRSVADPGEASLYRLSENGIYEKILDKKTDLWGDFLRYNYATFDFSDVKEEGIYKISYDDIETGPFKISKDVYGKGPWELTLDVFYPVQMCHMKVRDRDRLWHGACHMDDAMQVPSPKPFFDGYRQAEHPDSEYEPHTTIPGLNQGGWHDAADDDIHYVSTGRAAYDLALAFEEFGLERDQTTVDFNQHEVHLYQPDGIPDAIQQIIHGTLWLVSHYRVSDHAFPGVISSDWATYLLKADWSLFTDNRFYRSDYPEDSVDVTFSGKMDDRYVFTNRDTRRDYFAAAILSAISRVIKDYDAELSDECIRTAQDIWQRESNREPVFFRNVGTPRSLTGEKTNAAVELFLTTKDPAYLDFIVGFKDEILKEISQTGWTVTRVIEDIDDPEFVREFNAGLIVYRDHLTDINSKNPFGVEYDYQVWGIGWNILWQAVREYYLITYDPELFNIESMLDGLGFVLGRHPGNNISFVSGVGSHRPIPTYAMNLVDYGYIPGGVYSGTSLVLPDYPELRDDHPFLWQQSEIMIWGATPYIFTILAADKLLNQK